MQEKVLEILSQEVTNFQKLSDKLKEVVVDFDARSLKSILKYLREEKITIEFDKKIIYVPSLELKEAFAHSNLNHALWLEDNLNTNKYGIAEHINVDGLSIFNKSDTLPGSKVKYTELEKNQKKYAYVLDCELTQDLKVIASFNGRNFISLNNAVLYKFKNIKPIEGVNKDDIVEFTISSIKDETVKDLTKLGNIKDKGIEGVIVKKIYDLNKFNNNLTNQLEKEINKESIKLKSEKPSLDVDFFTIDAATTKDVDDAIGIKKLNDGYELYVAIADVSALIKKDSVEDKNALEMSTTYYLKNEKIHMLNKSISEKFCSLNIGEPKKSLIYKAILNQDGKIVEEKFLNDVINVKYKVSYKDIDALFNNQEMTESFFEKDGKVEAIQNISDIDKLVLKNKLVDLEELTSKLKKSVNRGYYMTNTDYLLNENGKIEKIELDLRDSILSQQLVEVSMLTANIGAANFLKNNYPYIGIFRNQKKWDEEENEKPKAAFYQEENEGHFGLQEASYTHFTSPIRRYCDLLVHRLIKGIINEDKPSYTKEDIDTIANKSNWNSYVAKQVEIREEGLLYNQYLQELVNTNKMSHKFQIEDFTENGIVLRNKQCIDVFLPYFKVNRKIQDYCLENVNTKNKVECLAEINHNWQFKVFLDNFNWLEDRKDLTVNFYDKNQYKKEEKPQI